MKSAGCYIGTSGWNYSHWKNVFYPDDMKEKKWLNYYAKIFNTVEINNSFYHLPETQTIQSWYRRMPQDFIFSVKAGRYITHMKKLKDPEHPLEKFLQRVHGLKEKTGPVLFQLPPRWTCNAERLKNFLDILPRQGQYAFEFRDSSWWNEDIRHLLEANNAAFCIYELAGIQSPRWITADFVYIRLHGPDEAYQGFYDKQTLSGWAGAVSAWMRQGRSVYCYFDNDQNGYAPQNASMLKNMLKV